ncbi:hypothetical protein QTN25_000345 [Entamoeba marina]
MKQSVKVKKGSAIDQSVTTKAIKRENDELHEQISLGFDDFITSNDSPNIPLQKQEEQQEEQEQVVVNDEINQQNELTKETIQPKRNDSPQPQPKENLNELLKKSIDNGGHKLGAFLDDMYCISDDIDINKTIENEFAILPFTKAFEL